MWRMGLWSKFEPQMGVGVYEPDLFVDLWTCKGYLEHFHIPFVCTYTNLGIFICRIVLSVWPSHFKSRPS